MSDKPLFIVLEGIDGSGKTTVGKRLAKELGADFCQVPMGFWKRNRVIFDNGKPFFRFIYYVVATIHISANISRILRDNTVVCDRYIYSTIDHNAVYWNKYVKCIPAWIFPIRKPDLIYYLHSRRGRPVQKSVLQRQ